MDSMVVWSVSEELPDRELQEMFTSVYGRPNRVDFQTILKNSLFWVSARNEDGTLIAFANVIWDGLYHALIVDRAALAHPSGDMKHEALLKVCDVLKERYPTVSKIHVECDEGEIPRLEPLGFERRTYGRLLW
ncbi:MAG: hypothetical protein ABW026_12280 [Microvirga sp.]